MISRSRSADPLKVWLTLVIVAILLTLGFGNHRCHARGGTYVRGLFWMGCVK